MLALSSNVGALPWDRRMPLVAVLAAMYFFLLTTPLQAATISLVPPSSKSVHSGGRAGSGLVLRLTGMIETGDAKKLEDMLDRVLGAARPGSGSGVDAPLATIELSSLGGNLVEGISIGRMLKDRRVVAVVRQKDLCLSACALALLGGTAYRMPPAYPADCNVEIGGKLAFHNFFLNRNGLREVTDSDPVASRLQGFADARGGAAMLVAYAGELGLPPSFIANLIARPVEDFVYVETVGQFLSLNICPTGLERPRVEIERQAANICDNSILNPVGSASLQITPISIQQAKQYLLERVQESMQSARTKGKLAEQLASWSVMRVKAEIDKLYEDLRAAGVALPQIVGPTYEVGMVKAGTYKTICYVSLSPHDPDSYEVVVQGGRGLSDAPRLPPDKAKRMFLFDQEDRINPRPNLPGQELSGTRRHSLDFKEVSVSPAKTIPTNRNRSD